MYYNDNEISNQSCTYNGQSEVRPYDPTYNVNPQMPQVLHINFDVNQFTLTLLREVRAIIADGYQRKVQSQALTGQDDDRQQVRPAIVNEGKYTAVYSSNGYGVFTSDEKLKLRVQGWTQKYQWKKFDDYQMAANYVRASVANMYDVPLESIPECDRVNWMYYSGV
jgi:hypothetical protein